MRMLLLLRPRTARNSASLPLSKPSAAAANERYVDDFPAGVERSMRHCIGKRARPLRCEIADHDDIFGWWNALWIPPRMAEPLQLESCVS